MRRCPLPRLRWRPRWRCRCRPVSSPAVSRGRRGELAAGAGGKRHGERASELFRELLDQDGQVVQGVVDDGGVEAAVIRQGDRLQLRHLAADGEEVAGGRCNHHVHRAAGVAVLVGVECDGVVGGKRQCGIGGRGVGLHHQQVTCLEHLEGEWECRGGAVPAVWPGLARAARCDAHSRPPAVVWARLCGLRE